MITAIVKGGLGNQLFQYAAAKSLALQHNTTLSLEISFFDDEADRNFVLDKLLPKLSEIQIFTSTKRVQSSIVNKALQKLKPWHKRKYINEIGKDTLSAFYQFPKECIIDGYWQEEEFIKYAVPSLRAELLQEAKMGNNAVAVHFRGGDYLNPTTAAYHGNMDEAYYKKAFELLYKKNTNIEFYLFSDNPELFEYDFLKKYKHNWVVEKDEIKAFKKLCTFHNFIIANSSFSWWPAFLNSNLDGNVIAPKQWFKVDHLKNKNPALDSWIKL